METNSFFGIATFLVAGLWFLVGIPYIGYRDLKTNIQAKECGLGIGNFHLISIFAVGFVFMALSWVGVTSTKSVAPYVIWVFTILFLSVGMVATIFMSFAYQVANTIHKYSYTQRRSSILVSGGIMCAVMLLITPTCIKHVVFLHQDILNGVVREPSEIFRFFVANFPTPFVEPFDSRYGAGLVVWVFTTRIVTGFILMPKEMLQDLLEWVTIKPKAT